MKKGHENSEISDETNTPPEVSENIKVETIPLKIINEQILYIQEIIQNTVISLQIYNRYELFSNNDMNQHTLLLNGLLDKSKEIAGTLKIAGDIENCIHKIQTIINELTQIISKIGTLKMCDLIYIAFGSDFLKNNHLSSILKHKYDLLLQNVHPIGFKQFNTKCTMNKPLFNGSDGPALCSNKNIEETIVVENSQQLECFDVDITHSFFRRCHEMKIIIHCEKRNKTIVVSGIITNLNISLFSNDYIDTRVQNLLQDIPTSSDEDLLKRQIDAMTIKEILIHGDNDIYLKNSHIQNAINTMKTTKLEIITKGFIELDLFSKRSQLVDMLLYIKDGEIQYLAYLLYDLLSNVDNKNDEYEDSSEQLLIYDSLSWKTRCLFKDAMKNTVQYNQNVLNKYENTSISIEQQIIFWRVSENIKERAFIKLKEIKGRMDDSGSKAKQYLEGLLRIPFETYRREPVLSIIGKINGIFIKIVNYSEDNKRLIDTVRKVPIKEKYTNAEIQIYFDIINRENINEIKKILASLTKKEISHIIKILQAPVKPKKTGKGNTVSSKETILHDIIEKLNCAENIKKLNDFFIKNIMNTEPNELILTEKTSQKYFHLLKHFKYHMFGMDLLQEIATTNAMVKRMRNVLDESIHGHENAKKQIMKIICQWMNGSQSGYCFGFEGSPGIGKTSLAKKGLAKCLTDEHDVCRPFSFIALGGSCNGSTLEGHSYTYLNSTWGRIADILMESKCMNPIIYIDELDKVSKSEHGKEIIGILTHLIDYTQNDNFQDKYFSGVPLDLSKALFIFSYNDVDQIDRVLLDRIHRIKFDNLSLKEKITISNRFIVPEINEKMGFHDTVELSQEIIQYIIENYTSEPGVRKLKEILFDLYGEINIELLEGGDKNDISFPIQITIPQLETYLKRYKKIQETKIHAESAVGIMNGLWANMMGKGGIIPIETMFFPTENFLELKLTGLQGDVMKESMNVAKTLVWSLCSQKQKDIIMKTTSTTKTRGIHVHCPEGGVSKDGPSAGAAIVIAIYSLLNKKRIKCDVAITGEISLQGNVTAIGGLENKIAGGIHAGIRGFIFPEENRIDFNHLIQKMVEQGSVMSCQLNPENKNYVVEISGKIITFILVSKIQEIFEHVFVQ